MIYEWVLITGCVDFFINDNVINVLKMALQNVLLFGYVMFIFFVANVKSVHSTPLQICNTQGV